MVEIDGSYGEGGGQILRTALGLSALLGRPFRIYAIRKARQKPGLMPQHLAAVRAAAEVTGARVAGAEPGSTEVVFEPGEARPGAYAFDIGTAGSTSLLAQSLLPPLFFAPGESSLTIRGGTHVPMSPPFHYLRDVFLPALERLGLHGRAEMESCGFYPRGGGKVSFWTEPAREARAVEFTGRGKLLLIKGLSAVANLPMHIANRQREGLLRALAGIKDAPVEIEAVEVPSPGRGTFVFFAAVFENSVAGFSALGQRGKRAEAVAEEAASEFLAYHASGACLEPHLADQLALYMGLARGESRFTVSALTSHLRTNLAVVEKFLPVSHEVDPSRNMVIVHGQGDTG